MLSLAGCTYTARYESEPAGATVYLDGVPMGTTPLELELDSNRTSSYTLRFVLEGYEPKTQVISRTPNGGSVTFQNTYATASGQATTYASANVYDYGGSVRAYGNASTDVTATGMQFTTTSTVPTFSWPSRFFCELRPRVDGAAQAAPPPPPAPRPAPPPPAPRPAPPPPPEPAPVPPPPAPTTAPSSKPAFCGSCGKRLALNAKFCGGCGRRTETP